MSDTHSDPSDSPDRLNADSRAQTDTPKAATKSRKVSRRQFGRDAAIVTAASFSVPALLAADAIVESRDSGDGAQGTPKTPAQAKPGAPTKPPESASSSAAQAKASEPLKGLTTKQVADVDAKLANILRKHPNRFSDAQKKRLRRILAQQERLLAPVRAFHVENGDSPASVLRVSFEDVVLPKQGGK